LCLNPLLVAGKYSTYKANDIAMLHCAEAESQSPFSSGEVFHKEKVDGVKVATGKLCLNLLLVAGKYSTGNMGIKLTCGTVICLNPLLVAGKYSTLISYTIY